MSFFTCQTVSKKHQQRYEQQEITSLKTSNEYRPLWKKNFIKNLLYFRIYADFDVDKRFDNYSIGIKTTTFFKQRPVCIGFYILSQSEEIFRSGYYESPLGYKNVNWFVEEVIKLEIKMFFFL